MIPDMTCSACSAKVEKTLQEMNGVNKANVNIATLKGVADYDETITNPELMLKAVRDAGYTPEIVREANSETRQVFLVEGMT